MRFDSKKITAMNEGIKELKSWEFLQLQTAYSRPAEEQNWTERDIEVTVDSNQVDGALKFEVSFPNPARRTLDCRCRLSITVHNDGTVLGLPAKMSRLKYREVREQLQLV